jgi:hypothetical protein
MIAIETAAQADHGGEAAVAWRGGIHQRRPALRQPQGARAVEGAGASPGRELADTVAGDHGVGRPGCVKRGPGSQRLRAAEDLPGDVGEQVGRSGFPHEATRILPQHTGRLGEDGLGLRAVRDEVEHRGMLTALPGAKYRHQAAHAYSSVRTRTTLGHEVASRFELPHWVESGKVGEAPNDPI